MDEFRALLTDRLRERGALARLSKESGIRSPVIGHWQRGETRPSPANLQRLAPALGVSYEDLMRMCEYLPGEASGTIVSSELDARLARLGITLSRYPRAVWIAVLEANERMADALASNQPPVSECPKDGVSASDGTQKLGKHDLDPPLTALKGRLAPAFA